MLPLAGAPLVQEAATAVGRLLQQGLPPLEAAGRAVAQGGCCLLLPLTACWRLLPPVCGPELSAMERYNRCSCLRPLLPIVVLPLGVHQNVYISPFHQPGTALRLQKMYRCTGPQ